MADNPKMRLQGEMIAVILDFFSEHFAVLLDAYATTYLSEAVAECRQITPDASKIAEAIGLFSKAWDDSERPIHTSTDKPERQGDERALIGRVCDDLVQCVANLGCDVSGDYAFAVKSIAAGVGCNSLLAFRH